MKRVMIWMMFSLLLTGCSGQSSSGGAADSLSPSQIQTETGTGPCTMTTEYPVYGRDVERVTVLLENHGQEPMETGADFALEVNLGAGSAADWLQVEPAGELCWTAIAYVIPPEETLALECYLPAFDLSPFREGHFRIVKRIGQQVCTVEFRISEEAATTAAAPYGFEPLEQLPPEYGAATAADTDVVFTGDEIRNLRYVTAFLEKVELGIPCQLRTVQDYGEGSVMVIDTICENDHFLWRMWSDGSVTEQRFSYLVTDGTALYLSNGVDWGETLAHDSRRALLIPEGVTGAMLTAVERQAAERRMANVARYRIWSENAEWDAALTEEPSEFTVSWRRTGEGGWGQLLDIRQPDRSEIAVRSLQWLENGRLLLICDAEDGGTGLRVFDAESEIWSDGNG